MGKADQYGQRYTVDMQKNLHLKFMMEKIQQKFATVIKEGGFFGGELAKMGTWKSVVVKILY